MPVLYSQRTRPVLVLQYRRDRVAADRDVFQVAELHPVMVSLPQDECLAFRAVDQRAAGRQGQLDVFHVVVELRVLEYRDQSAVVEVFVQRRESFTRPGEVADSAASDSGRES